MNTDTTYNGWTNYETWCVNHCATVIAIPNVRLFTLLSILCLRL